VVWRAIDERVCPAQASETAHCRCVGEVSRQCKSLSGGAALDPGDKSGSPPST